MFGGTERSERVRITSLCVQVGGRVVVFNTP